MEITRQTVEHVAKLASLALNEAELETYPAELTKILGFVEQLNSLPLEQVQGTDTASKIASPVTPTLCADGQGEVFRADVPQQSVSRDALLSNATEVENHSFVVPNIL
ncbi:MAG: Asp-tRNA(Asn)/Glu-tRNA(Gln) amidotransferase subunit GatC [Vampirovibrionales bacterium]